MLDTEVLNLLVGKRGLSVSELGRKSDMSKSAISDLMTGKRNDLKLSSLEKISVALGVDAALLIKRSGANERI